ncbi:MAG: deacylase [Shinella sp.]|nr:MAG: deacylase [Shinella sp.]
MHTGLFHSIDFNAEGKQFGWLSAPFSVDRSPYFHVRTPICTIRNGDGPSVLLMAGNHGDEYEGEINLKRLIRSVQPADIKGRLTILPFANMPAVMSARRCSPLDGGNLNRAFPGSMESNPTSRMANFLERELFPKYDIVFDMHSGGTSMAHLPTGLIEESDDAERHAKAVALLNALGMPYAFIARNGIDAPTSMAAAARAGAIGISGEFGGGGSVTPETMSLTALAINNLLIASGLATKPLLPSHSQAQKTRLLSLNSHDQAIYATRTGWFEPAVDVGAEVEAGDVAGWYHNFEQLSETEEELRFAVPGVVISRRLHTQSQNGDCLIQVGRLIKD